MDVTERKFSECIKELEGQAVYFQGTNDALLRYERAHENPFECRLECLVEYPKF